MNKLTPLNTASIYHTITPQVLPLVSQLVVLDQVDSTNRYVLDNHAADSGFICVAEQQTQGRGRRGRCWQSPHSANIYLSLLWKFPTHSKNLSMLSLAVGIAVAQALQHFGLSQIQLKWPNDIVYADQTGLQKLGGILLEMQADRIVIGIGLNVLMPQAAAHLIEQTWTDITTLLQYSPDRNELIAVLLSYLLPMLANYLKENAHHIKQQWQQFDVLYQRNVIVTTGKGSVRGIAKGIDDLGGLLVITNDLSHNRVAETQCFYSGDVSVRLVP